MRCTAITALAVLALASHARADSGAYLGESARAVSLADAVVARPGDTSAIYFNPAGIADLDRPTLTLYGHLGNRQVRFARAGELGATSRRVISGYGVSLVARLPGPEWLQRVRIGGSVHLPGTNIIRVIAPVRSDVPIEPYYGGRTDRTAVTVALGVELPYGLRLGAALSVTANLVAPTSVGFDASRGEDVDDGVIIAQDRDLTLTPSFVLGGRWQVIPELAFGLVWRQGGATRASGTFDIRAGSIEVLDEYRFYDLLAPEEVALGVAVAPIPALSLSLDLTWGRWSDYRTIHEELPDPLFSDVVDVRAGAEWRAHESLRVRLGYGFLPSPVPEQVALHNFLDSHRHELAFGLGLDLEPLVEVPVTIDLALRFHAQHRQRATKDAARLGDATPDTLGQTIENLGYPGFRSRGSVAQVALAITVRLDGAPRAASTPPVEGAPRLGRPNPRPGLIRAIPDDDSREETRDETSDEDASDEPAVEEDAS